jgi:hypothetical protein
MDVRSRDTLAVGERPEEEESNYAIVPKPRGTAYVDRLIYRSVHFHGSCLHEPLGEAVNYLRDIERANGEPPFVVGLQHQYSREDDKSQLAWQVTLVIGFP